MDESRSGSIVVVFIISLVISTIIVNAVQRGFMKAMNMDAMSYSIKGKLIAILIVALLITGLYIKATGG